MGIRSKFDSDFKAINLSSMADDMLAQVVANHAADRFRVSNRANTAVAGGPVPYTVAVNGRPIFRGAGEVLSPQQLALALRPAPSPVRVQRRMPTLVFNWAWESLQPSRVERAIQMLGKLEAALGNVQDAAGFLRMLAANDRSGILRMLLEQYAQRQYPELFARLDQVKALYRVYRLAHLGGKLIAGGGKQDADPDVLAWIARELRARSPFVSGGYRDGHTLYADGEPLMPAADVSEDSRLPEAREFSFTNTVPYARKIEFGKTQSGRDFVVQVPNRIYERLAEAARERFRGAAEISFEMRAVIAETQTPQRRARRPHNVSGVRYPSIVVRF